MPLLRGGFAEQSEVEIITAQQKYDIPDQGMTRKNT
jgi:hypothetical protein